MNSRFRGSIQNNIHYIVYSTSATHPPYSSWRAQSSNMSIWLQRFSARVSNFQYITNHQLDQSPCVDKGSRLMSTGNNYWPIILMLWRWIWSHDLKHKELWNQSMLQRWWIVTCLYVHELPPLHLLQLTTLARKRAIQIGPDRRKYNVPTGPRNPGQFVQPIVELAWCSSSYPLFEFAFALLFALWYSRPLTLCLLWNHLTKTMLS